VPVNALAVFDWRPAVRAFRREVRRKWGRRGDTPGSPRVAIACLRYRWRAGACPAPRRLAR